MNEKHNCNAVIIGESRKKALKTYCQMHDIYFEISEYWALTKEHSYYFVMVCEKKQMLALSEFIESLYK